MLGTGTKARGSLTKACSLAHGPAAGHFAIIGVCASVPPGWQCPGGWHVDGR